MDDDIHFRNEERKKTGLGGGGGGEGWEKKAAAAVKRKGEEKMLRLAPIKAWRRAACFFAYAWQQQ